MLWHGQRIPAELERRHRAMYQSARMSSDGRVATYAACKLSGFGLSWVSCWFRYLQVGGRAVVDANESNHRPTRVQAAEHSASHRASASDVHAVLETWPFHLSHEVLMEPEELLDRQFAGPQSNDAHARAEGS